MMKQISIAFVAVWAVVVGVGCKKGGGGGGDCGSAISSAIDRSMAASTADFDSLPPDQRKGAEDGLKALIPKMKTVMTTACVDDKWSADVIACVAAARDQGDIDKCDAMLTTDQKTHAEKAMQDAMANMADHAAEHAADHDMTAHGGSAAVAPAAGSAASGSAAPKRQDAPSGSAQ